jgi:hypothetical protein
MTDTQTPTPSSVCQLPTVLDTRRFALLLALLAIVGGCKGHASIADTAPDSDSTFSHGQVAAMQIPVGWVAGTTVHRDIGAYSWVPFSPPNDSGTVLAFYYRGLPTGTQGTKAFRDVLAAPPHPLSPTELSAIGATLRVQPEESSFPLRAAETRDLHGKRIVLLEGHYLNSGEDVLHLFVDASPSEERSAVQEIIFQAKPEAFARYRDAVQASLASIVWVGASQ